MLAHGEGAACLGRSDRSMMAGPRPGTKWELEGGLTAPQPRSCVAPGA